MPVGVLRHLNVCENQPQELFLANSLEKFLVFLSAVHTAVNYCSLENYAWIWVMSDYIFYEMLKQAPFGKHPS